MKAIMLMFDSLNRHMLPSYGCDWVQAPNFQRLAERTCTFENSYVASMPCMPARRDLHTGRVNFLHCSWGPMEPFDDSMPRILKENGVKSCLISDHLHYWEEGGANYHTKYSNWECIRGQEGDPWWCDLKDPADYPEPNTEHTIKAKDCSDWLRQDWVNRSHTQEESDYPQVKTVSRGLDFLERNHETDSWFLQIETFDPHEPFHAPQKYRDLYDVDLSQFNTDWPDYVPAGDDKRELSEHYVKLNAAMISFCDAQLGRVLDTMDRLNLWDDTLLIVNTDHGFLLGEHDWWGKCMQPFYNEIAHTPLFIWDPRSGKTGERRKSLVQTTDLPPTLLEFFGLACPPDMTGRPLKPILERDEPVRESALFGMHGAHVNVTDGRYVYMRAPASEKNRPLYSYTHMPAHMKDAVSLDDLKTMTLVDPFAFTKGCPVMRIEDRRWAFSGSPTYRTLLFDLEKDPGQLHPIQDESVEKRMKELLIRQMKAHDAPEEQYVRLGLV